VSLSEPDGTEMVYTARFPSHKRFLIHMSVGRRLPCKEVQRILRLSSLRAYTPMTLTDSRQILRHIDAARDAGYAWTAQEYYRGDLTIAAPVLAADGAPVAAINISATTSRWTLDELRARFSSVLLETARAASSSTATLFQR
jgi:IclR family transcriptional regulator, pca regulon regulatory protein